MKEGLLMTFFPCKYSQNSKSTPETQVRSRKLACSSFAFQNKHCLGEGITDGASPPSVILCSEMGCWTQWNMNGAHLSHSWEIGFLWIIMFLKSFIDCLLILLWMWSLFTCDFAETKSFWKWNTSVTKIGCYDQYKSCLHVHATEVLG